MATKKRQNRISHLKKHLCAIEELQERKFGGEKLTKTQLEKIVRFEQYTDELRRLQSAPTPTASEAEMTAREVEQDDIDKIELEFSDDELNDISFYGTKRRGSVFGIEVEFEVNDRVKLIGGKTGIVRYNGPVDFSEEPMVGIALDNWDANAHSGTVKDKEYFVCPPGRGFFAKTSLIVENMGTVQVEVDGGDDEDTSAERSMSPGMMLPTAPPAPGAVATTAPAAPAPVVNFKIGDRVKLLRGKYGIVKFIGETHFSKGEIIGLELETWHPCGHTGTVRGKKYFQAGAGRGYFTRRGAISEVVVPMVKPLEKRHVDATFRLRPFKIGDHVVLRANGQTGVMKYKGYPSFAEGEVIGIELDEWDVNAHDGTVDGVVIFEASPGRGIFVRRDEIDVVDENAAKLESAIAELKIGDRIELTNHRKGTVKYIGPTSTSRRTPMVGVHLDSWTPGAKNGVLKGVHYFSAPDGRGVFVRKKDIVGVMPALTPVKTAEEELAELQLAEAHYTVGDRVIVEGGRKGTIRYVGRDYKSEEVYGIEMDDKVSKGTDGRHNHRRYFTCRAARAIFVRKKTIQEKLAKERMVTYDVGDTVKLSRGRLGQIKYTEDADDGSGGVTPMSGDDAPVQVHEQVYGIEIPNWSHRQKEDEAAAGGKPRRRMSIQYGRPVFAARTSADRLRNGSDGVEMSALSFEHLLEEPSQTDQHYTVGETVELLDGRHATVRFVGKVAALDGDMLGVEIHDGRGKNDGVHKGVRYFTCAKRKGIFVQKARRRLTDEPSRQFLKRKCPECDGKFLKLRNPRAAYNGIAMVCDRCSRHGSEFREGDWYYQCSGCQQVDLCLECMLALPSAERRRVSKVDFFATEVRAKYCEMHGYYMFDDKYADDSEEEEDEDEEDDISELGDAEPKEGTAPLLPSPTPDDDMGAKLDTDDVMSRSRFVAQEIKDVFEYFDSNTDGILEEEDITEMYYASKEQLNTSQFFTPMNYATFQKCWQEISPVAAQNILHHIDATVKRRVAAVFSFFDFDMDDLLRPSDIERLISMSNKQMEIADFSISRLPEALSLQQFQQLWPLFEIPLKHFLEYLLSRIHTEIKRRERGDIRKHSMLYRPVSKIPGGDGMDAMRRAAMEAQSEEFRGRSHSAESSEDFDGPFMGDLRLNDLNQQISESLGLLPPVAVATRDASRTVVERGGDSEEEEDDSKAPMNVTEAVRNVFEYFDRDADGTLTREDVLRMLPVLGEDYMNQYGMNLLNPPCEFIRFYRQLEELHEEGKGIVRRLHEHVRYRIEDVFLAFTQPPHAEMSADDLGQLYALVPERRTEEPVFEAPLTVRHWAKHWGNLDAFDQQCFLTQADERILTQLRQMFNFFDVTNIGRLSHADCKEIANAIGEGESFVESQMRPPCPFDKLVVALESLDRHMIDDMLPKLKAYMEKLSGERDASTGLELSPSLSTDQKLKSITALARAMKKRPSVKDLMDRRVLWGTPDQGLMEQQIAHATHRRRMSQLLDQKLADRPMLDALIDRGILVETDDRYSLEYEACLLRLPGLALTPEQSRTVKKMFSDLSSAHSDATHGLDQKHISRMKQQLSVHSEESADSRKKLRTMVKKLDERQRLLAFSRQQIESHDREVRKLKATQSRELEAVKRDFEKRLSVMREKVAVDTSLGSASASDSHTAFSKYYDTHTQQMKRLRSATESVVPGAHATVSSVSQAALHMQQLHYQSLAQVQTEAKAASHSRVEEVHAAFKEALLDKEREIEKLKADKLGMKAAIDRKLQELKFAHSKEVERERAVAAALSRMLDTDKDSFMKQLSDTRLRYQKLLDAKQEALVRLSTAGGGKRKVDEALESQRSELKTSFELTLRERDAELAKLQTEAESLRTLQRALLKEQRVLKKSKRALEKQIVKLSDAIVATLGGAKSGRR